jgi:transposase
MMAEELILHARGRALIADTGYDADRIVDAVRARGMKPVIHCNPTRKRKRRLDRKLYSIRYHVECLIHRIKRFRAVATRYEKTARNYLALVELVCAFLWLKNWRIRDLSGSIERSAGATAAHRSGSRSPS